MKGAPSSYFDVKYLENGKKLMPIWIMNSSSRYELFPIKSVVMNIASYDTIGNITPPNFFAAKIWILPHLK